MTRLRALLAVAALTALAALAGPGAALGQTPLTSLPDIEDEVMCVVCGVPLNLAEAPQAEAQRAFIRRRVAAGESKEQVKAALVAEFGSDVLALPDGGEGIGWAAYAVPIVAVGLLALLAALLLPRWRRRAPAFASGPGGGGASALSPAEERRLDEELARADR